MSFYFKHMTTCTSNESSIYKTNDEWDMLQAPWFVHTAHGQYGQWLFTHSLILPLRNTVLSTFSFVIISRFSLKYLQWVINKQYQNIYIVCNHQLFFTDGEFRQRVFRKSLRRFAARVKREATKHRLGWPPTKMLIHVHILFSIHQSEKSISTEDPDSLKVNFCCSSTIEVIFFFVQMTLSALAPTLPNLHLRLIYQHIKIFYRGLKFKFVVSFKDLELNFHNSFQIANCIYMYNFILST